jgi:hypothetical protein
MDVYERSDPGDPARPVGVKFIPHRDHIPALIHMMPVSEHEAALSESVAMLARQAKTIEQQDAKVAALERAVRDINRVQTLLMPFTHGSSTISERVREAFNINAKFLSDHPEEQNKFLGVK